MILQPRPAKRSITWIAIGLLGFATFALSGVTLWAEQSHLLASGASVEERADAFVSGQRQVGFATITQRWFVIDCRNTTIMAYRSAMPTEKRREVAESCLRGAQEITSSTPASSFAWVGAAHASVALQDWDGMSRYLANSYSSGPQEGWIARYRVELAQDNWSRVSGPYRDQSKQDLALLANNMSSYATFLAQMYVRHPAAREALTEVVEQLPTQEQRRFLGSVSNTRTPWTGAGN